MPLCDLVNLESHDIAVLKSDILLEKQLDAGFLLLLLQLIGIGAIGTVCGFVILFNIGDTVSKIQHQVHGYLPKLYEGFPIIPFKMVNFVVLDKLKNHDVRIFRKQFSIEPLLICMVASSIAAHRSEWRSSLATFCKNLHHIFCCHFYDRGLIRVVSF